MDGLHCIFAASRLRMIARADSHSFDRAGFEASARSCIIWPSRCIHTRPAKKVSNPPTTIPPRLPLIIYRGNSRILRPTVGPRQRRKDHPAIPDQSALPASSRWRPRAQPGQDRPDRRPECRDHLLTGHEPEDLGRGRTDLDARAVAKLLHQLPCGYLCG